MHGACESPVGNFIALLSFSLYKLQVSKQDLFLNMLGAQ